MLSSLLLLLSLLLILLLVLVLLLVLLVLPMVLLLVLLLPKLVALDQWMRLQSVALYNHRMLVTPHLGLRCVAVLYPVPVQMATMALAMVLCLLAHLIAFGLLSCQSMILPDPAHLPVMVFLTCALILARLTLVAWLGLEHGALTSLPADLLDVFLAGL